MQDWRYHVKSKDAIPANPPKDHHLFHSWLDNKIINPKVWAKLKIIPKHFLQSILDVPDLHVSNASLPS